MSKQVVVLGGGYAGVMAANRLAAQGRRAAPVVTMVTTQPRFVERIRLHEYAAGARSAPVHAYESLLHPDVRLQIASARRIDPRQRLVEVDTGDVLGYDYLITAIGSGAARPSHAGVHSLSGLQDAERAARAVAALPAGASLAVVGGGLTAVEVAAELAERRPALAVQLHTSSQIAPGLPAPSRLLLRGALARLGVDLREGSRVIEDVDPRTALGVDLVIRCVGFTVPSLAIDSDLPTTADGRIRVDAALTVDGRIFGAGDGAFIDDDRYRHLRMSCAAALPMGAHAADNILRLIAGREPEPLSAGFVAQCISIGRRDALVQPVTAADEPRLRPLRGRVGALTKELVCRQTLRWMRGEARHAGSYSWPKGPNTSKPTVPDEQAWT